MHLQIRTPHEYENVGARLYVGRIACPCAVLLWVYSRILQGTRFPFIRNKRLLQVEVPRAVFMRHHRSVLITNNNHSTKTTCIAHSNAYDMLQRQVERQHGPPQNLVHSPRRVAPGHFRRSRRGLEPSPTEPVGLIAAGRSRTTQEPKNRAPARPSTPSARDLYL